MIQDYTKTNNLEVLLKILQDLFSPNKGLFHLFIGIYIYIYILIKHITISYIINII